MLIRQAKPKDLEQLCTWMTAFTNKTLPYGKVAREHIMTVLQLCMSKHVCLVAVENDKLLGTIVGIYGQHPLNPKVSVLQELAWWVSEAERASGVGTALLQTFADLKSSDITVVSTLPDTPEAAEKFLERTGFKMSEKGFVKDNRS